MSRSLTAGMVTEVTASVLEPIILMSGEFDSGDVNLWSGVGSIVWDGITFTGAGSLLGVKEIRESQTLEAVNVDIQLSGLPSSLVAVALTEDYQNRPVTMWIAALDGTGAIIADPYKIYRGRMDVLEIEEGAETATLTMHTENRLVDLQRTRERRFTPEDQKAVYPDDTGLDGVSSLQDRAIVWGQASAS